MEALAQHDLQLQLRELELASLNHKRKYAWQVRRAIHEMIVAGKGEFPVERPSSCRVESVILGNGSEITITPSGLERDVDKKFEYAVQFFVEECERLNVDPADWLIWPVSGNDDDRSALYFHKREEIAVDARLA